METIDTSVVTPRNKSGQFLARPANAGRKKGVYAHKSIANAFKAAGYDVGVELVKHYSRLMKEEDKAQALALLKQVLPYIFAQKRVEEIAEEEIVDVEEAVQEAIRITSEDARAA